MLGISGAAGAGGNGLSEPLVVVTDSVFPDLVPATRILEGIGARLELADEATPEGILRRARQADGLLVTYAQITAEIIAQLERCRVIGRFGIGVDNVDVEAASRAGIVVTYVPDYCIDEVSDHALALLLALARKVVRADRNVQGGRWEVKPLAPIHRLRGGILGLVGFGKIARALAPKARALGLEVLAFDPYVEPEDAAELGVRLVGLEELLRSSDHISIHVPLTAETRGLFGRERLRQMKRGALLVNTARGPILDAEALVEALEDGRLGGAALDVLPEEPPPEGYPLLGRQDVILTPHLGFYSVESLQELQTEAAQEVARVLSGQRPRYPVNAEALEVRTGNEGNGKGTSRT